MNEVSLLSDTQLPDQIACLLIPMESSTLLLPNESVAEVVSDLRPEKKPNDPDWCLGEAEWRGLKIPVLSYEKLSEGNETRPGENSRLIVMNSVTGNKKLPFYALLSKHAPKLVRAFKEEINEESTSDSINKHHVTVHGEKAIVPDLDMMEEKLLKNDK